MKEEENKKKKKQIIELVDTVCSIFVHNCVL